MFLGVFKKKTTFFFKKIRFIETLFLTKEEPSMHGNSTGACVME